MTAKEKAEELYCKYYLQLADGSFYNAKKYALISVDEIISSLPSSPTYWEQVKHELNKLQYYDSSRISYN